MKQALFENLDEICKPGACWPRRPRSLPVIECATATAAAGTTSSACTSSTRRRSCSWSRWSPRSVTGADVDAHRARRCASTSARRAVSCGDRAGFIVNALLFPYLNDAVKMLEAHYATADDIDIAMKQGCG